MHVLENQIRMLKLVFSLGFVIVLTATSLITNTPNTYGCSSSSNSNQTDPSSSVNGTSGNLTKSGHIFTITLKLNGGDKYAGREGTNSPC